MPDAPICPACNHSHWPGYPHVWGNAPRKACSDCLSKDMELASLRASIERLQANERESSGRVLVTDPERGLMFKRSVGKDDADPDLHHPTQVPIAPKPTRSEIAKEMWRKRKEKAA